MITEYEQAAYYAEQANPNAACVMGCEEFAAAADRCTACNDALAARELVAICAAVGVAYTPEMADAAVACCRRRDDQIGQIEKLADDAVLRARQAILATVGQGPQEPPPAPAPKRKRAPRKPKAAPVAERPAYDEAGMAPCDVAMWENDATPAPVSPEELAAEAKAEAEIARYREEQGKAVRTCDKCNGSGMWYGRGYVENGVFKGKSGKCYGCGGSGKQTPKDVKRCNDYWRLNGRFAGNY